MLSDENTAVNIFYYNRSRKHLDIFGYGYNKSGQYILQLNCFFIPKIDFYLSLFGVIMLEAPTDNQPIIDLRASLVLTAGSGPSPPDQRILNILWFKVGFSSILHWCFKSHRYLHIKNFGHALLPNTLTLQPVVYDFIFNKYYNIYNKGKKC